MPFGYLRPPGHEFRYCIVSVLESFSATMSDIFWVDTTLPWCLACVYLVVSFPGSPSYLIVLQLDEPFHSQHVTQ